MLQSNSEKKSGVGIIVGRFHVPALTEGHRELFDSVIARHDSIRVVLGVAPIIATKTNPLDFDSRRQMIQDTYPQIKVSYIYDSPSNIEWVLQLDKIISLEVPPSSKVMLYGSRESFLDIYKNCNGRYPFTVLEPDTTISGTRVREIVAVQGLNTEESRRGAIWATMQQFDRVCCTVDIAPIIYKDKKISKVLLAKKSQDLGKYRFVGGFVDPGYNDEGKGDCFEHNAQRELLEEAHLEASHLEYLGTFYINDWRYRTGKDKVNTIFFAGVVSPSDIDKAVADDDIDELEWVDVKNLCACGWTDSSDSIFPFLDKIADNHKSLAKKLISYILDKNS